MPSQQRPYPLEQFEQANRLGDVLVGVEPEAADLVGFLPAGAYDDDRHAIPARADGVEHLEPRHAREHQIEQDEVGSPSLGLLEACPAVGGNAHLIALALEVVAQTVGEVGVVFHQKDPRGAHGEDLVPATGIVTQNSAPPPGAVDTVASPPKLSAISRTSASPMPLPPTARVLSPVPR